MASVTTREAIGDLTGGGEGERSLLGRFKAEVATFGPLGDLFFDELSLQVFTIMYGLGKKKNK